jgi:hypothetical protein
MPSSAFRPAKPPWRDHVLAGLPIIRLLSRTDLVVDLADLKIAGTFLDAALPFHRKMPFLSGRVRHRHPADHICGAERCLCRR